MRTLYNVPSYGFVCNECIDAIPEPNRSMGRTQPLIYWKDATHKRKCARCGKEEEGQFRKEHTHHV